MLTLCSYTQPHYVLYEIYYLQNRFKTSYTLNVFNAHIPPPPHYRLSPELNPQGGREKNSSETFCHTLHPQSCQQQCSCCQSGNRQLSVLYRMIRLCSTRRVLVSLLNACSTSTKLALSTPMYICTRFISADQNLHSMYVD